MKRAADAATESGDDKRARAYNAMEELKQGGVPIEWIKSDKLVKDFDMICAVCQNVFYRPVATRCGHVMCRTCYAMSMQTQDDDEKKCPVCRSTEVAEDANGCKLVQRMTNMVEVRCPNTVNDPSAACAWEGAVLDLQAHLEKVCTAQAIACPHCDAPLKRVALAAHVAECPRAPKHCAGCDMMVASLETHACSAAEIVCQLCGTSYRRMHATLHRDRVCTNLPGVPCPLRGICCPNVTVFARRAEMEAHLQESAAAHVYDAVDTIRDLQRKLAEARDHLSGIQSAITEDVIVGVVTHNQVLALQAIKYMGFDLNARFGASPLLNYAAGHAQVEMVETLIALGANVNARNTESGRTPLHVASDTGNHTIGRMLLNAGARTDVRTAKGDLPDANFVRRCKALTN